MLYKIEHLIYPLDIYIHIGENIYDTLNQFINNNDRLTCDDNWDNCDGKVYRDIINKIDNAWCLIIAFSTSLNKYSIR